MGKKKQTTNIEAKSRVTNFYGTKAEWIKAELDVNINEVFSNAVSSNEKALVAEDEAGLYITCKSYVNSCLLDPYRMYNRVTPSKFTENDQVVYKI